jgi:hypothetical protein
VVALTAADTPIRAFIQRPALRTLSLSFLGMATVLLFVRTRAAKLGSAAAIALAVLTLVPSIAALDVFRSDRFTRETAAATEVARVTLEGNAMALELSPKGDRFLVRGYGNDSVDDEEEDDPRAGRAHYTVGSFDGAKRRVEALQAALVDDAHILVLRRADRALELRLEGDDSAAVWTVRLPIVRRPVLTVSPPSQRWTVLSNDPAADSMIVVGLNTATTAGSTSTPSWPVQRIAVIISVATRRMSSTVRLPSSRPRRTSTTSSAFCTGSTCDESSGTLQLSALRCFA